MTTRSVFFMSLLSAAAVGVSGCAWSSGDHVGGSMMGGLNLFCWFYWVARLFEERAIAAKRPPA